MKKKTAAHIRLGREGERLARRFLEFTLGYELIEHNLKLHSAEIDLLMRDGKTFVLVEVKSTRWRGEEYHPGLHYTTEQQIRQQFPGDYAFMKEILYPQLRAVDFRYNLRRVDMVKDTVVLTVLDTT